LRTRGLLGRGTREDAARARAQHRRAIEIDPNFAAPYAGLAIVAMTDYVNGWADDPAAVLVEAERLARRAVELNEGDATGHMALGGALMWRREHDAALAEHRRSIELDPNFARGFMGVGMTLIYAGRATEALEHLATSMRLDPHYSNFMLHLVALAHFGLGHFETAAERLLKRITLNPNTDVSRMLLASCWGHLGRLNDARAAWAELLKVNPGFSLAQRARVLPYKDAADFQRISEGLAKAGLA
jgi:Flp pilus assembly protein TadD